jgi:osmoprotectant transport system ATP-binding protein
MIHLAHVFKNFDGTRAVNDFSLHVEKGEVCVLIGPSGCGKTTTLRMINRLVEPDSGKILVNDVDISKIKAEQLRRNIGYAIQSVGLFPHLTVAENIAVVPELLKWDKARISNRVNELLSLVELNPDQYSSKYVTQLSGGEAQRIGVARALAADPPILLMDEPFGAVDPLTRQRLQTQFISIQKQLNKTVILVTHDLDEAIRLADRIAVMQFGSLIQFDTPESILAKPINKFVHDFVGVDRALKRLSRIKVENFIQPAPFITTNSSREEIVKAIHGRYSIWVLDEHKQPVGWVDRVNLLSQASIVDMTVRIDTTEISIANNDTLREALSRMLGLGFKSLPVVDNTGVYLGEITLSDIEAATIEPENSDNA